MDGGAALTLGKAVAGLTAQSKGRRLGIFQPLGPEAGKPPKKWEWGGDFWVELCGRSVAAKNTDAGLRALVKDRPIDPEQVRSYLGRAFGEDLSAVREAVQRPARSFKPDQLGEQAFGLYEEFRPAVAQGKRGSGQKGELDLKLIRSPAREA